MSTDPGVWQRPRKIEAADRTDEFTCGIDSLDTWLHKFARTNHAAGMASCFVCTKGNEILAYYALASAGIAHSSGTARAKKGIGRYEIPAIVLARLAVAKEHQGTGLGAAMLRDALIRTDQASEVIGVRCLLVHAKDEKARDFYMRNAEFEPSPTDPLHLILLMKDLRLALKTIV